MKKTGIFIAACAASIVLLLSFMWVYSASRMNEITDSAANTEEYDKNYMLVTDDSSSFISSVYESSREQAQLNGDILQWVGQEKMADFTLEDELKIALFARADGIILDVADSTRRTELLAEAADAEIPVVTVMEDSVSSGRVSFVGFNNYLVGQLYGREAAKSIREDDCQISILTRKSESDAASDLFFNEIVRTIDNLSSGKKVSLTQVNVSGSSTFDTEEIVWNLFTGTDVPDVILCLDDISTECAIQAAIDYNQVGNVSIIGFFTSDTILDAIRKGVVQASLYIDTDEIGKDCIRALDEYLSSGRVSDFFPVSCTMVTSENVSEFIRENTAKEAEGS